MHPELKDQNGLLAEGGSCEKTFNSKKNNVYLVKIPQEAGNEKKCVFKRYSTADHNVKTEREMLTILKNAGVPVPEIFKSGTESILLEYIEGPTLLEYLTWQENIVPKNSPSLEPPVYQTIYSLCHWLKMFYTATEAFFGEQLVLGDVNLRNFIIRERIYGLDFEECRRGVPEEDVGRICAFLLTYDPPFTSWKTLFVGELFTILTRELSLDRERTRIEFKKELLAIARRRGVVLEMLDLILENFLERAMSLR